MTDERDEVPFPTVFERRARAVRRPLLARRVLTGLAVGLLLGAGAALVAWTTGAGELRPLGAVLGLVGAAVGLLVARRRRWSDVEVALWLDARLDTREVVVTAVELRAARGPGLAVVASAARALADADPRRLRPAALSPVHALVPAALVALVLLARLPVPAVHGVSHGAGASLLRIADAEGLRKVAALATASARDAAQHDRLAQMAREAEQLRADLARGVDRREALDRASRLRDEIAAERLTLGDREGRAGLEAAISRLQRDAATGGAASALGDHDLERMDRDMERLANAREKQDRASARRALAEAAAAARAAGAAAVGRALEEQQAALEGRESRAQLLRDLARALDEAGLGGPEPKRALDALDRGKSDEAARQLAEALGKALEGLTPDERKRLAEKLRRPAGGPRAEDPEASRALADALSTPEGRDRIEQQLKDLAREQDESPEARGQAGLDDAERGAAGAEAEIGGRSGGAVAQGGTAGPGGQPGGTDGPGAAGHHHDTGTGAHTGHTDPVESGAIRSRAQGRLAAAPGMPGTTTGWTPGRARATADVQGTGALGAAGPGELDGVDRSEVPEDYREQVRQYFQP